MSERAPRYFQFPLALLAFGPDEHVRLRTIIGFCVVTRAQKEFPSDTKLNDYVARLADADLPADYGAGGRSANLVTAGCHLLHVANLWVAKALQRHALASRFVAEADELGTARSLVRVRTDLFWATLEGRLRYRDFAVLCAVYSVLGANKHPVRVTRDTIIARALGYSVAVFRERRERLLASRADGAKPLTVDQVRWTLDDLESRRLFARTHIPKSRVTLFSHRLSPEEIRQAGVGWKLRREEVRRNRAADRETWDKRPSVKKTESPVGPHLNSQASPSQGEFSGLTGSPHDPQVVPASSPEDPHATPRFDITSIEPFKETPEEPLCRIGEYAREEGSKSEQEVGISTPTEEQAIAAAEAMFPGRGDYGRRWYLVHGANGKPSRKRWQQRLFAWVFTLVEKEQRSAQLQSDETT